MSVIKNSLIAVSFFAVMAMSQSPEPPLSETRLTVHTLLREDIFAGFMDKDMERFARGEKNIDLLIAKRPEAKSDLLAWKAGAVLYRAVLANEANHPEECKQKYQQALDLSAEAHKAQPPGSGLAAITGGTNLLFADRLPKEYRAAAWAAAYSSYQEIWKQQGPIIAGVPLHFKGEVLGGLAKSALKTGHKQEATQYLDKMIEVLKDTPYAAGAKALKEDPGAVEKTNVACLSCHDSGRLGARLAGLEKK